MFAQRKYSFPGEGTHDNCETWRWERPSQTLGARCDEKVLRPFNRKTILTALTRRGVALKEEMEANGKAQSPD